MGFLELLPLYFKEIVIVLVMLLCMSLLYVLVSKSFSLQKCGKIKDTNDGHTCELSICPQLIWKDFRYCVLILFICIVFICTLAFSENRNVVNYISFAGTLTSMILSILAIMLTLLDSSKMDANKTKMDNIIVDLNKITSQYKGAQDNLNTSFKRLEELINEMDKRVNSKLNEMNDKLRKPNAIGEWADANKDWNGDRNDA